MNQAKAMTMATQAQRSQVEANQSTSWPLSRTTCRHPTQTMRVPKPMLSKAEALAFLMYGGSWMKRLIM